MPRRRRIQLSNAALQTIAIPRTNVILILSIAKGKDLQSSDLRPDPDPGAPHPASGMWERADGSPPPLYPVEAWGFSPTKNTTNQKAFRPGLFRFPTTNVILSAAKDLRFAQSRAAGASLKVVRCPLLGRPLHEDEARYFSQVVRRIAAILLMGPALDANYAAILPSARGLTSQ